MASSGSGGRGYGVSFGEPKEAQPWDDFDFLMLALEVLRFLSIAVGTIAFLSAA